MKVLNDVQFKKRCAALKKAGLTPTAAETEATELQDSGVLDAVISIHRKNPNATDAEIDALLQKEGYEKFRVVRCEESSTYELYERAAVLDYTFFGGFGEMYGIIPDSQVR